MPVMLLQMLGVSSFFLGWDTELTHDLTVMAREEIGKFIQLYPKETLFVNANDLQALLGQKRPCGLLYSNNVLSVFVVITIGYNLALSHRTTLNKTDYIISIALVLTMSKLVLFSTVLFYLTYLILGDNYKKQLTKKLLFLFGCIILIFYFFFPGVLISAFDEHAIGISFFLRFIDVIDFLGIDVLTNYFEPKSYEYLSYRILNPEESYSGISIILKNQFLILIIILFIIFGTRYVKQIRKMHFIFGLKTQSFYALLLICLVTQFAVPYFGAVSFQTILGYALFPLFPKLWRIKY